MTENLISKKVKDFQELIGYQFKNEKLLIQALTTPQFGNEKNIPHYEIFETLGDAVIKLIFILKKYHEGVRDPGTVTKTKQHIENDGTLSKIAEEYLNLNEYVLKAEKQELTGTHILADVFEALCGAIFLDAGKDLKIVERKIIDLFYQEWEQIMENSAIMNKNRLLEYLQDKLRFIPSIQPTFKKLGPDNNPKWIAENPKIFDQDGNILFNLTQTIKGLRSKKSKTKKEAEKDLYYKIEKKLRKKRI